MSWRTTWTDRAAGQRGEIGPRPDHLHRGLEFTRPAPPVIFQTASSSDSSFSSRTYFASRRALLPYPRGWGCSAPIIRTPLSDANMVQAYAGAVTGLGGARIMVAQRYLEQAMDILAAYERGDFALDEFADVGLAEHDTSRDSSA